MAAGKAIAEPLKGAGQPNPACETTPRKVWGPDARGIVDNHDTNENSQAITLLITYGKFRMLDPADLTWNKDRELFCPVNSVGTVDLYMTANHGTNNANSPVMVHALRPRVVIADNGPKKGAAAETFQTIESSPGLEDYWQAHYLISSGDKANTKPDYIANIEGSPDGKWIKVSAEENGTFTVTNTRNNFSKTYRPRIRAGPPGHDIVTRAGGRMQNSRYGKMPRPNHGAILTRRGMLWCGLARWQRRFRKWQSARRRLPARS